MERKRSLFEGWDTPMLRACLQGHMGRVETWGEDSALAGIGDFCFLAGRPVPELVERTAAPILVPCGAGWAECIEAVLGERAAAFTRYATQHAPEYFNRDKLLHLTAGIPQGFRLVSLSKGLYPVMMAGEWSHDLCGCFADAGDFARRGIGAVILWEGRPVSGAASYAVCDGAIEIEIDTDPAFRGRGLAAACGARLILDCLDRGLYPGWDAHDGRSLALARKLGYRLKRPYTAYWVEEKVRSRN